MSLRARAGAVGRPRQDLHEAPPDTGVDSVSGAWKFLFLFPQDPEVERERAAFLASWRAERDCGACRVALARLEAATRGDENLVPQILAALTTHATLGEVFDALRKVFGVYEPGRLA